MNRRLTSALVVALLGAGALAGCAATPDLTADAAKGLQASVQTVATHAAANDLAAAITELDALQARLDDAVASGDISAERAKAVQANIDLVRADLAQRVAEAEAAAAAEAQRIAEEKQVEADRVLEEQRLAEAQRLIDEQAAEDAKDDKGDKGNNGNGKGNDDDD